MPATIERAVPYMAFAKRVSSVGAKVTFLSATVTLTAEAKVLETLPLGPSTRTVPWVTTTLTLSGMGTGCLPIRLMVRGGLPNVAKQFTAGLGAAAVLILQQALRGGEDADAEAVQDARNLGVAVVEAAAGRGDADQAREGGRAGDIFHRHDERLVPLRVDAVLEVGDIALGLEDGGDGLAEFGVRRGARGETGLRRIAEAGQKITDRIGHGGCWLGSGGGSYPTPGAG